MRSTVPHANTSAVQQYLNEIDAMDLVSDGYFFPTEDARERILELAAFLNVVFGETGSAGAQPWSYVAAPKMVDYSQNGVGPEEISKFILDLMAVWTMFLSFRAMVSAITSGPMKSVTEIFKLISFILDA